MLSSKENIGKKLEQTLDPTNNYLIQIKVCVLVQIRQNHNKPIIE